MTSLENLIPVINKVQDVFSAVGSGSVDLPQIVVVGSQSSGKSSVLESLVGRDFLPRGSGIVTRRPLVLQLINVPKDEHGSKAGPEEWGEFLHKPGEMYTDFTKIRDEIVLDTDRVAGSAKSKCISSVPIHLKIFSSRVVTLTLVDLPGMTRVPVGEQPSNIETQLRTLILEHISRPSAVILAVTAANTDLANSDALQLARDVDPEGIRTVGVLTKLDLMDRGTDAVDVLSGRLYPLKLGFIALVNRSQQDIISEKPVSAAIAAESKFFASHPVYSRFLSKCGTSVLANTLHRLLMQHIRNALPNLKTQLQNLLTQTQQQLSQYGDPLLDGASSRGALLLQLLTRFSAAYRDAIDGRLTDGATVELYGGARINYIFHDKFASFLSRLNPLDGLSQNDIRTALRNATGPRNSLFVPEAAFELLVKRQVARLLEPSLQCIDLVFEELQRIVSQLEAKELSRFSVLRERVLSVVNQLLQRCRTPAKDMVDHILNIEMAFVNTSHPDFIGSDYAMSQVLSKLSDEKAQQRIQQHQQQQQQQQQQSSPQQHSPMYQSHPPSVGGLPAMIPASSSGPRPGVAPPVAVNLNASTASTTRQDDSVRVPSTLRPSITPSDKERFESELIQSLLVSYFNIVRKNVLDAVPKAVMHFLVIKSKTDVQNDLVARLYKEELLEELLAESTETASRRKACQQMLDVLLRANAILADVRDQTRY
jgi:dynamin 1-like protein